MTKLGYAAAALVLGISGFAAAAVPGWARQYRLTRIDVASCASTAASAMQRVTGKASTTTRFDANTYEIRNNTANEMIFAYCTAAPNKVCSSPAGELTILTFSSAGSGAAATIRDRVNTEFGDPRIIDCGPVLNPV
jgi:hypothetical protein